MSRFGANKRGSLGSELMTETVTSQPTQTYSSPAASGVRGSDDAARMIQNIDSPKADPQAAVLTTKIHNDTNAAGDLNIDEDDDVRSNDFSFKQRDKSRKPFDPDLDPSPNPDPVADVDLPVHPGTVLGKHKPPLQRLENLPGLSIVTWEEFLENPALLGGLFEADKADFIHFNSEQVNVFFHDSRLEQTTLGAPSGDGLSW